MSIRIGIAGYGNLGRGVECAIRKNPDMELKAVFTRRDPASVSILTQGVPVYSMEKAPEMKGEIDVLILCGGSATDLPVQTPAMAQYFNVVDSFDTHAKIPEHFEAVDKAAKAAGKIAVISAGWDPGSDSVVRTLLEACAPKGITDTNFGPGMSMGHSVAAKGKPGVRDALSMTIPLGTGIHRRNVYIELEEGYDFEQVKRSILEDDYFCHDETHVFAVPSVDALMDKGHGVNLVRKGVSGQTQNQLFEFNMKINNPALTSQIMVACARAAMHQAPGCYVMPQLPVMDLLPGTLEEKIRRLV